METYLLKGFYPALSIYPTYRLGAKHWVRLGDSTVEQEMDDGRVGGVEKQNLESGCPFSGPSSATSNCVALGK